MSSIWILFFIAYISIVRCELLIIDAVGFPIGYWLEILNDSHPLSNVDFRSDPAMLTPDANQEDISDAVASAFRSASDPNSFIVCGPATISQVRAYASTLKSQQSSILSMAISTENILLNRKMFPNVQPMIPNMDAEALTLSTVISYFQWHQISFIYAQSSETQSLSVSVLNSCSEFGITVYPYTFDSTLEGLRQTMKRVKDGSSYIIVIAVTELQLLNVLTECKNYGLTEAPWQLILMPSSSRRIDLAYENPDISSLLDGVLSIQTWINNITMQEEAKNLWSRWYSKAVITRPFIPPAVVLPPAVMGVFYTLYRIVWSLAEIAVNGKNNTESFIRDYLYTHNIDTAVGTLSFDSSGAMHPLFTITRLGTNIMDIQNIATFTKEGIKLYSTMIWRGSHQTTSVPNDRYKIPVGSSLSWIFSSEDIVLAVTLACACGFVCTIMFESMLQSRADGQRWVLWLNTITILQSCCTWSVSILAFISMQPQNINVLYHTDAIICSFLIPIVPWIISMWILIQSRKKNLWIRHLLILSAAICVLIAHYLTFGTLFWSNALIVSAGVEHNSGDWVLGAFMGILCISGGFEILVFWTKNWLRYTSCILLSAGVSWMIFTPLSRVRFIYNESEFDTERSIENTSLRYICLATSLCVILICLFLTAVIRGASVVGLILKTKRAEEQYNSEHYKLTTCIKEANYRHEATIRMLYTLAALHFPGENDPLLKESIVINSPSQSISNRVDESKFSSSTRPTNENKFSSSRIPILEIVNEASKDPIGIAMILSVCSRGMKQEAPSFLLYLQALRTKPMICSPYELGEYIFNRFLNKNSASVLNLSEDIRCQAENKLHELLRTSFPSASDIDLILREVEREAHRLIATNLSENECELLRKWRSISRESVMKLLKEPSLPEIPHDLIKVISQNSSTTTHDINISSSPSLPRPREQNYIKN